LDTTLQENLALSPLAQRPRHVHDITDRFSMTNTYLIDDGRLIVVDPGSVINVYLMLQYLKRFLHRSPSDIDLIVLTHLHPDHTAGVETLRKLCHAPVAASVVARYLVQRWKGEELDIEEAKAASMYNLLEQMLNRRSVSESMHHVDLFTANYERQVGLVDLWLEDVAGLPGHPAWRVIASPGLTPEGLCLYNPFSYELLCGDIIITVEGRASLLRSGANRRSLEETLETLHSLKVRYVYPGHGRPILADQALKNLTGEL
jgi:hydroxyacylglutathione hydrolase